MKYSEITNTKIDITYTKNIFLYLIPITAILSFFLDNYFFNKQINISKTKSTLLEKLNNYEAGLIIQYILLEGASILGIFAFTKTSNLFFYYFRNFNNTFSLTKAHKNFYRKLIKSYIWTKKLV